MPGAFRIGPGGQRRLRLAADGPSGAPVAASQRLTRRSCPPVQEAGAIRREGHGPERQARPVQRPQQPAIRDRPDRRAATQRGDGEAPAVRRRGQGDDRPRAGGEFARRPVDPQDSDKAVRPARGQCATRQRRECVLRQARFRQHPAAARLPAPDRAVRPGAGEPAGVQASAPTGPAWPSSTRAVPSAAQIRTVPSQPAEARVPSGATASAVPGPAWPSRTRAGASAVPGGPRETRWRSAPPPPRWPARRRAAARAPRARRHASAAPAAPAPLPGPRGSPPGRSRPRPARRPPAPPGPAPARHARPVPAPAGQAGRGGGAGPAAACGGRPGAAAGVMLRQGRLRTKPAGGDHGKRKRRGRASADRPGMRRGPGAWQVAPPAVPARRGGKDSAAWARCTNLRSGR